MASTSTISNVVNSCNYMLSEQNSNIVFLFVFLISYAVFGFLFKSDKFSPNERNEKIRQAEEYLRSHEKEDRDFFIGQYDE